jgi:hypothetical protein
VEVQGDILAAISKNSSRLPVESVQFYPALISNALRTATPLPQITPGPLVERFMKTQHGLNNLRQQADNDYGLPGTVTVSTLEDEQYM